MASRSKAMKHHVRLFFRGTRLWQRLFCSQASGISSTFCATFAHMQSPPPLFVPDGDDVKSFAIIILLETRTKHAIALSACTRAYHLYGDVTTGEGGSQKSGERRERRKEKGFLRISLLFIYLRRRFCRIPDTLGLVLVVSKAY